MSYDRFPPKDGCQKEYNLLRFWPATGWSAVVYSNEEPTMWTEPIAGWALMQEAYLYDSRGSESSEYITGMGTSDGGMLQDLWADKDGYVSRYVLTDRITAEDEAEWEAEAAARFHRNNTGKSAVSNGKESSNG